MSVSPSSRSRGVVRRTVGAAALAAVVLASAAAVLAGAAGCGRDEPAPQKTAAARVDGVVITQSQVDRVVKVSRFTGQTLADASALEQLIAEELIRREAERLGVSVASKDLDGRLQQVAESVGGQATLEEQLRAAGLTMDDLRRSLQAVMLGEALQAAKFKDLQATRAEALAYYRQNLAQFATPETVDLGAIVLHREANAEDVIRRIEAGLPFETAARQFSVDPEGRANRGMLGWIDVSSLPAALRAAEKKTAAGQLSEPVEAGSLWYVLKVFGRRPAGTMSFADVSEAVLQELTRQKQAEALATWVKQERAQADVKIPG